MKIKLLTYLLCPQCRNTRNKLKLYPFDEKRPVRSMPVEIKDGLLYCECGKYYPIINFIPRMTVDGIDGRSCYFVKKYSKYLRSIREDIGKYIYSPQTSYSPRLQVKDSYNFKWGVWPSTKYNKTITSFLDDWFMRKLGISSRKQFNGYFKDMRSVLDAGTGLGTKIETIATRSDAEVIGVDLSGVEYAFKNNKSYPNAHVVGADIFNLPFKNQVFDFIVSDGVLHHTPDTKKAFYCLVPLLKKGGKISIHVYKKMGPIREFTDDYIRSIATGLSPRECLEFCKPFTHLGKALSKLNIKIKIPEDIGCLQIEKGTYDLQRFMYYAFFQCFWNSNNSFKENNIINFDWFHPANAHRHSEEEVLGWFKRMRFEKVNSYKTNLSGVSVVGVK